MRIRNLVFAALTPIVLIALIAAVVSGFGSLLLAVRYMADDMAHHGQMTEEVARLYPVGIAVAVATVFLIGGMIASRMAPQVAPHDDAHAHH